MKTGLVLEGGGMRGLYTNGALDCLMDNHFAADYVVGVSAGACGGVSYVSGQRGRSFRVNTSYLGDSRYVGLKNLITKKSMFGMDFLFDEIPNRLDPFDYDAFFRSPIEFTAVVTDAVSGAAVYFTKDAITPGDSTLLRASSAIPVFSPAVRFRDRCYLDGGTSDPIPVRRAIADGCDRVVVILTRDRSYQKSPEPMRLVYRRMFKDAPGLVRAMDARHETYNDALDYLRRLEREGRALIIAPTRPVQISRFEKDVKKLENLYRHGILDAQIAMKRLREWM